MVGDPCWRPVRGAVEPVRGLPVLVAFVLVVVTFLGLTAQAEASGARNEVRLASATWTYTYDTFETHTVRRASASTPATRQPVVRLVRGGLAPALSAGQETALGFAAEDTTSVGRWMGRSEFDQMASSGRVVEGGGGRTYVVRPPSPDAYPAGKGVYAEFDVPTSSLHPASKPEYAVIPGPNAGTTRYGPLPERMPSATCIELVCTR